MTPAASVEAGDLGAIILGYRDVAPAALLADQLVAGGLDRSNVIIVLNAAGSASTSTDHRVVPFGENLGYAAGMNAGLKLANEARWDYVALLTHDVAISSATLVELAEILARDEGLGVVAPLLLGRDEQFFSGGGGSHRGGVFHLDVPDRALSSPEWLDGAVWVARTTALRDIGGFDERYFLYVEDVDASFRLRRRGWRVAVSSRHRALQEAGAALPGRQRAVEYLSTRNLLETYRKDGGQRSALALAVRRLKSIATDRRPAAINAATLRGVRDYALRRFGPPPAVVRSGSDIVP